MGLYDDQNHLEYYQGNNLGSYQLTSLDDIINQFMVAYVGEDKIIPKVKRTDVAFHAQRALAELSFDTFRSIKTQQIDVPATLTMPLPHDYVNYTRIMSVDSAGIKHPLYPTRDTQNPFQIAQEDDGSYMFQHNDNEVVNGSFNDGAPLTNTWSRYANNNVTANINDNDALQFKHATKSFHGYDGIWGFVGVVYQQLDVSDQERVDLTATGLAVQSPADTAPGGEGILKVGLTRYNPATNNNIRNIDNDESFYATNNMFDPVGFGDNIHFGLPSDSDKSFIEWKSNDAGASTASTKTLKNIDVRGVNAVWVVLISYHLYSGNTSIPYATDIEETNKVDNIVVEASNPSVYLKAKSGNEIESSTWQNYKSTTPSENNNDYYENDTYCPHDGSRYGLEPSHAQVNGSFFIDQRLGKIHFSSNISGKTIVLDYISDSLGTDAEMQVHKFAEEAMYKWIMYAVLSTRANIPEYIVQRLKKERFAEIRKAKLRLSNIKLEELTQILRGKSKQIKH